MTNPSPVLRAVSDVTPDIPDTVNANLMSWEGCGRKKNYYIL